MRKNNYTWWLDCLVCLLKASNIPNVSNSCSVSPAVDRNLSSRESADPIGNTEDFFVGVVGLFELRSWCTFIEGGEDSLTFFFLIIYF
jgi:hypothetical protein